MVEGELNKELRFHLEQQIEENLALGMPPDEAHRAAFFSLGGFAQIQEACRDARRTNYIEAARVLARNPGFTLVIVLTLALSIGASSAISALIHCVLLKPLPYAEPGQSPAPGRVFEAADYLPGKHQQVILSDGLWRARFSADPEILERKITLASQPFVVAGVMPPGVFHPENDRNRIAHGDTVDLWWPLIFEGNPANRGPHYVDGVGRLKRGITPRQAQGECNRWQLNLRANIQTSTAAGRCTSFRCTRTSLEVLRACCWT